MRFIDLTGQIYTKLTVVEKTNPNGRSCMWVCRCECGNTTRVAAHHLKSGRTKSCGCLRRSKSRQNGLRTPPTSFRYADPVVPALNHVIGVYMTNARRRNHVWELSWEDAARLLMNKCHYCGRAPLRNTRKEHIKCNGIDRIDNTTGYTNANTVPSCALCNRAKGVMSYADFVRWLDDVVSFRSACNML